MLHLYPDFYKEFHCIASDCPDTCCQGWEIVVDDDTARFYDSLDTPLGKALREAMTTDEDGDRILRMNEAGHCPFWNADRLCQVEVELGHQAPCATCRKFPRLTQDYGAFTEHGLTLACPEAARLILTHEGPWYLEQEGELGSFDPEVDPEFLAELTSARQVLLEQLWRPDVTDRQALGLVLVFGQRFQSVFDGEIPPSWDENIWLEQQALQKPGSCRSLLRLHRNLEILTPEWKELLDRALLFFPTQEDWDRLDTLPETDFLRNLVSYYLYRYWFQAVADYDCALKLQLLAVNWAVIRHMMCMILAKEGELTQERILRLYQLYAKEVEHDAVNREAIEDALQVGTRFSMEVLLSLI